MKGRAPYELCLTLAALSACADANQNATGGALRFDAARPPEPSIDGGEIGLSGGSTWRELYADYFGPTGRASCAGDGQCHGAADQPGAQASGYVCAPDESGCYASMTAAKIAVAGDTITPVEQRFLHLVLRKSDGSGIMPKRPASVVFTSIDMDRIDAWLRRGAPHDAPQP